MKLSLHGLLRLQPFDQSSDPPKPAWIHSWWFGGMLFAGALSGALGALSLFSIERPYTAALCATSATLFLLAGVVEWYAGLKASSLNSLFGAAIAIAASVLTAN